MNSATHSNSSPRNLIRLILLVICSATAIGRADKPIQPAADKAAFEQAVAGKWENKFSDPCTGDWKANWFLDGKVGTVKSGPQGMELTAGPEFKNDAHHMVLWTKQSFEGDLKIDYDYTRLDNETRYVTILYIEATGSGKGPYAKDITKWSDLRNVPSMATYYNHMNAYHISYAAFPNNEETEGYIRARRYMPERNGIKGTNLHPEYDSKNLFATGVKHHITVIKHDRDLFVRIQNSDQEFYCHIKNTKLPAITEGRIGLRQMFTRSARYANFRVSTPVARDAEKHGAALNPDNISENSKDIVVLLAEPHTTEFRVTANGAESR